MSRDDDQTWAELVDTFHSTPAPDAAQPWPAAEEVGPDEDRADQRLDDDYRDVSFTFGSLLPDERARRDPSDGDQLDTDDDADHFVPPTPAPIPRGDRISRLAWAGVVAGPVGLVLVAILSWRPPDELLLLAVVAFIAGFVTLIARMRGHHPNDPDDGAVL